MVVKLRDKLSLDDSNSIKIIVTGDLCPINNVEKFYFSNKERLSDLYGDLLPILQDKDLSLTNLESPLTNETNKLKKVGPCLKAKPESINILKAGDFDVVCLANNHILDYKKEGVKDTLNLIQLNKMECLGAGMNSKEASKALIIERKEKKIAILNYAEEEFSIAGLNSAGANPFDIIKVYNDIIEIRKTTSIIIVIIHGGIEGYNLPSPEFKKKLHFIAGLNPTAILCHHTHMYSGYEILTDTPVFYSLGNFIFDYGENKSIDWNEGYIVKLEVGLESEKVNSFEIIPYRQNYNKIGLEKLNQIELERFYNKLSILNKTIANNNKLEEAFYNYVKKNGLGRLSFILNKNLYFRRAYKYIFPFKFIINYLHNLVAIYGVINSDSHREILQRYLLEEEIRK